MPRTSVLLEKSIAACISGIEIYNKPDFKYREETFTILMINAWELLLKSKILKDNKNNIQSIYIREPKRLASGLKSNKHTTVKKSRSGNPMSIELLRALDLVAQGNNGVTIPLKENIIALCEIRDNAVHFKNDEADLGKIVLELGTASLKNYLNAVKRWFDKDLSKYNFYLMPLSFFHEFESVSSYSMSKPNVQLDRLLKYLGKKALEIKSDPDQDYNLLLKVETRFVKSTVEDSLIVKTVRNKYEAENPNLVQEVILTEEDITKKYTWTHKDLCIKLKQRYPTFKQDYNFNALIKQLKSDNGLCHIRLLNPSKPKGPKTFFYSPNCIQSFFDSHYNTSIPAEVIV
ncbi:DUF3644 domain-containing protein [Mucilaginibacter sp.]